MLKINKAQLETMRDAHVHFYKERLISFLKRRMPQQVNALDQKEFDLLISGGIERARHHGFSSEQQITLYVVLCLRFGPDFDRLEPWACQILTGSGDSDSYERLELLLLAAQKELRNWTN